MKKLTLGLLFGFFLLAVPNCTQKPSQEEMNKLEEAKSAAEAAEKKLHNLRVKQAETEKAGGGD